VPLFSYKGYDAITGDNKKGQIDSDSPKSARIKLRKQNIIVATLKEESSSQKSKSKSPLFKAKVSLQDLSIMTRQFATLQQAHVPLDESLRALTAQVENDVLRSTLAAVKDLVHEGRSLADACATYPNEFNRLYINMVRAGETSGNLGVVLERLSDFQEYQVKIRGQVISALMYPCLMITASLGIIAYLFISVVPKLQKVFTTLKVTLPWYTLTLITASEFLQKRWYVVIAMTIIFYLAFSKWVKSEKGRKTWDHWMLVVPVLGPIVTRINVSKFTRTLSTLLSSGVPIIRALEITRNIVGNVVLAEVIDAAKTSVQEGQSLGLTIERSGRFPSLVTHMIMTGEKTGELEKMLEHVAHAYDAEVERKISGMISLIEPLMIMVMAGIVTVVVIAMLIPMLSIMNQIR
jgi:general secretion pathway protein F